MDRDSAVAQLAASLGAKKAPFVDAVRGSVRAYISSCSVADCLTILEKGPTGDRARRPEVSADYVRCLVAFCANRTFAGHTLDSALSEPVVRLVSKQFEVFYEENGEAIAASLTTLLLEDRTFAQIATTGVAILASQIAAEPEVHEAVAQLLREAHDAVDLHP